MEVSGDVKLPVRTNCVACSEDGRYIFLGHLHGLSVMAQPQPQDTTTSSIFLGHPHGLSVMAQPQPQDTTTSSSSSPYYVPVWQEDRVEITSLHITCLGEMAYLLASLDDM
ncbi:hypothetical protein J4Q44_G00394470, partial [Coregonus suidteri]